MTVSVLLLFLVLPWVALQCVIAVFTDYTHLLFVRIMHLGPKMDPLLGLLV